MSRRVLVELDAGGDVRGFVCDGGGSVTVEREDGSLRGYGPGLDLAGLPARIAPFDGGSVDAGAPQCVLQLAALDLWGLRDRVPTQSVRGRVFWWPEGEVLTDAHEIYRGVIRDPSFALGLSPTGEPGGSVSFTLAADTRTPDVPFPPSVVGDEDRFPTAPDESLGQAVPVIYGTVRGVPLYAVSTTTGAPGAAVRLLVAGHRITSTTLDVWREGVQIHNDLPVLYDFDGRGDLYAYVQTTVAAYAAGQGFYSPTVTGWAAPDGSAVERLGDVLLHIWGTYCGERFYELDRRRCWGNRPRLNRYKVGLLVNERQASGTVLRLLGSRIQGQFPVTFGFAGGRFGWDLTIPLPPDGGEPAATLIYGENAQDRQPLQQGSVDDIITEFEIAFAQDYYIGAPQGSLRADRTNNGDCRAAETLWGASPVRRIEAPDVPDADTAYTLLTDAVWWGTRVPTRVEYTADDGELYDLPSGSEVRVTDSEAGWAATPLFLESAAPVEVNLAEPGHDRWAGKARVVLVSVKAS